MGVLEGIDFQLIPTDDDNAQGWDIRILKGDFIETVIRFGNISFNGPLKCLNFNYTIVYSPDDSLAVSNVELQEYVGSILETILDEAAGNGTLAMKDINEH
jgi:hypothetical protein